MNENNTYEIEMLVRHRDCSEAWRLANEIWYRMNYERWRRKCTDIELSQSIFKCDNKNPIPTVKVVMNIGKCSKIVPYIFMKKIDGLNSTTEKSKFNHFVITIRHNTPESMIATRGQIHDQLVGMDEYIDCGIVLSEDAAKKEIHLIIEAETNCYPEIAFIGEAISHSK